VEWTPSQRRRFALGMRRVNARGRLRPMARRRRPRAGLLRIVALVVLGALLQGCSCPSGACEEARRVKRKRPPVTCQGPDFGGDPPRSVAADLRQLWTVLS